MAYYHLSLDNDKYQIFIDNSSSEDFLDRNELSTASSFIATLDSSIDLSSLLYLKSSVALMTVSNLSIDNLPLCFSGLEYIIVTVHLPAEMADCNQFYNSFHLNRFNVTPYKIPLEDFSTSNPESAVSYINSRLGKNVTFFYLKVA